MELEFRPATPRNRAALEALTVGESQQDLIETVEACLREADGQPLWRPVGIYDGEVLVGFAMYGFFPREGETGRCWLDRLMIDRRYQGRGYGAAALRGLTERLRAEFGCERIYLSVYERNRVARRLYERHGFALNGERDQNGELVMVKELE